MRTIRFRAVLSRYEGNELNQIEAAEMLGLSKRTFRRWCGRFEEEGGAGLLDRRLGRPSPNRAPADDEAEIERLYRTRYKEFTARHLHEHLVRDHLYRWSYTWTKLFLQSKDLLEKASQRWQGLSAQRYGADKWNPAGCFPWIAVAGLRVERAVARTTRSLATVAKFMPLPPGAAG